MVSLLVSMFLFVVGLFYLYFVERDIHLQVHADHAARASYLARSAVEFYCYNNHPDPNRNTTLVPGHAPGDKVKVNVAPGEFFQIEVGGTSNWNKTCICRGWIEASNGQKLAERVYKVPTPPGLSLLPVPYCVLDENI